MKTLIVAFCTFVVCVNVLASKQSSEIQTDKEWEEFKLKFERHYESAEEEFKRQSIWESNKLLVQQHNQEYELGLHSYTKGINMFSDLTDEEINAQSIALMLPQKTMRYEVHNVTNVTLPDTVDWRTKGYVTNVKNQGACMTCYAFSSIGALEGQYYKYHKKLKRFSEQQLMDCSRAYGNSDCNGAGGTREAAYDYIRDHGIMSDSIYPYISRDRQCAYDASKVIVKVKGYRYIPEDDEIALMHAVATVGPISVSLVSWFSRYRGGVYDNPSCSLGRVNHAVVIVGYGRENGKDYWLVKNSYGPYWGDGGYIKLSRNKNSQCRIASDALYPVL